MFGDDDEDEDEETATVEDVAAEGGKKKKKAIDPDGLSLMQTIETARAVAPESMAQSDKAATAYWQRFSSGIFDVDVALGGGWTWGTFCGIFGPASKGKTVLTLISIGSAQRYCRYCRFMFLPNRDTGELECVCSPTCKDCGERYVKRTPTPEEREAMKVYRLDPKTKLPTKQLLFDFFHFFDEHTCGCKLEKKKGEEGERKPKITERAGIVRVCFVDIEESFTADWAKTCGCRPDWIFLLIPEYAEQAVNVINHFIRSRQIDIVAVDSLAAMAPIAEVEAAVEENQMMVAARMLGRAFRKWRQAIGRMGLHQKKPMMFCINQLRAKQGANRYTQGGDETRPGGRAQEYFSSIDVKVTATYKMTEKGNAVYADVKIRTVKNKTAPSQKRATYRFYYQPRDGHPAGDVNEFEVVCNAALDYGVLQKRKNKYYYEELVFKTQTQFIEKMAKDQLLFLKVRETALAAALKKDVEPRALKSFEEPVTLTVAPTEEEVKGEPGVEATGSSEARETPEAPRKGRGGARPADVQPPRSPPSTRKW